MYIHVYDLFYILLIFMCTIIRCVLFLHQGLGVVNDIITLIPGQQSTRIEGTEQSVQGLFSSSRPSGERGLPLVTSLFLEDRTPPTRGKEKKVVIEIIEEVGRGLEDEETIQRVEQSKTCAFNVKL